VYLQALDDEGRLVQSMRTFVQAAPGTTRSCVGCHEYKYSTTAPTETVPEILGRTPDQLEPESWGSGYLDYPSMVQPVLDKHCVRCHGGEEGIAAGMDLSGGWTEHFNISYENLANRLQTQLVAHWISGIDCMNGTALWSAQIFAPRQHGSGNAPLAELLVSGHDGHVSNLARAERDLLMAWIDTNGLYHGTWDSTGSGCAVRGWSNVRNALVAQMQSAGCLKCHGDGGRIFYFENDWINLKEPQLSRILRAPLGDGSKGFGIGLCRDRKVDPRRQRIHMLWRGYAHAVQPPEAFPKREVIPPDLTGDPVISFASTDDPHYQAMLAIVRDAREKALASPRIDMPGAEVIPGACRVFVPPPLPKVAPELEVTLDTDGVVHLAWERSARTIGLEAELHRSEQEAFTPNEDTLLVQTALFKHTDRRAATGKQYYALILMADGRRSVPAYASVTVPPPPPPPAPTHLKAVPASCSVRLQWNAPPIPVLGYHVFRGEQGTDKREQITSEPIRTTTFSDVAVALDVPYTYVVRAVSRRGSQSEPTAPVEATAILIKEPMFSVDMDEPLHGRLYGGQSLGGKLHGAARIVDGTLDLKRGGHATFPHRGPFDLGQPLTVECWVHFDQPSQMPVIVSCGLWNRAGWFLQWLGNVWRWHVGGIDCDGGQPALGRWVYLVGVYDGQAARLFEDGKLIAEKAGAANTAPWPGALHVGQYSGQPGAEFQVTGRIAGLKIYHRPLDAAEIAAAAKQPPE
jgi:hypothetical protein